MEQTYDILLSNYLIFELEILNSAANAMIYGHSGYEDTYRVYCSFNRTLLNLFTTTKHYTDILPSIVKKCTPDEKGTYNAIVDRKKNERLQTLEYRAMEALRNHAQHNGLPVHWITFQFSSRYTESDRNLVYAMEQFAFKERLAEDKLMSGDILSELPDKIDLVVYTRTYIERMSSMQSFARKTTAKSIQQAQTVVQNAFNHYQAITGHASKWIVVSHIISGKAVREIHLVPEWEDIRIKLSKRNSELPNLRKRFVTGEIVNRQLVRQITGSKVIL